MKDKRHKQKYKGKEAKESAIVNRQRRTLTLGFDIDIRYKKRNLLVWLLRRWRIKRDSGVSATARHLVIEV